MKKSFLVVYEKGKKNYSGFAPDVTGCGSLGNTLDEIRMNLREALELYMSTALEFGYPLPQPVTDRVTLPIEGETDPNVTYVVERLAIDVKGSIPKLTKTKRTPTKRRALQAA